jgi:Mrp family chromosome partitioning ATPase
MLPPAGVAFQAQAVVAPRDAYGAPYAPSPPNAQQGMHPAAPRGPSGPPEIGTAVPMTHPGLGPGGSAPPAPMYSPGIPGAPTTPRASAHPAHGHLHRQAVRGSHPSMPSGFGGALAPMQGPPRLLPGADPRIVALNDPYSARANSYRVLRDNLLAKGLPRVLAISSPAKGDGKTTCALNLAVSLAEGARVLLMDGNLITPSLAKVFGIIDDATPLSPTSGPWIHPYRITDLLPSLALATLALPPGVPSPRFERRWCDQLVAALHRAAFDFCVIDGPSLLEGPMVRQLTASADATLLAVRCGVTTARSLRRAAEMIPEGKGIGVALIDAKP